VAAPTFTSATGGSPAPVRTHTGSLALLASLFFMWGFITVINNTLLPHLRNVFQLDYTRTTLIESVWFVAYFVASIPAALLIERIGYRRSIVVGLLIMAAGSLGMIVAARLPSYPVTLASLFVVACGIALLQVAANPFVTALGPPETAESRLTLVQAFNSTGTWLAPLFGGVLILSRTRGGTAAAGAQALSQADRYRDALATQLPYALVAGVLIALAVVFARARLAEPAPMRAANGQRARRRDLLRHRNLVFGVPAIFIYLIAEIGVANLFINFVSQPDIGNVNQSTASHYLMLLWGGMAVGRFAGSYLMRHARGDHVLAGFALAAFAVMVGAAVLHGPAAMWALILVGLCHSIMFPTIFTLGIKGLGPLTEEGAGLLIMAISGGALVVVQGRLADVYGLQTSFWLTAACELYVLFYAVWGCRVQPR